MSAPHPDDINLHLDEYFFRAYKKSMSMLTTKQVAERLGVSVRRVHALIQGERLPAEKIGRDYLIKEADLRLVADRPTGRPPKQAVVAGGNNGELRQAEKTTRKLNETFRKAVEDERHSARPSPQAGKKKDVNK